MGIRNLIEQLVEQEAAASRASFVAPCLPGGRVRARVAGMVRTYRPAPRDFEGWGVFRPWSEREAELVEEADLPLVAGYLRLLRPMRFRLAHPLQRRTWLGYPVNEADARQRLGAARPFPIHLVESGARFEQVVARWDGAAWWFEEADRRADPALPERLDEALKSVVEPPALRFPGLTPEMRATYELATSQAAEFSEIYRRRREERRLRDALALGGGELSRYHDRGEFWLVEWTTRDGERHQSAVEKKDFTVVSAGICLSDRDRDFDLQSLVGVVERQWEE